MSPIKRAPKDTAILTVILALAAYAANAPTAAHHEDECGARVYSLDPSTHGNPEGIAFDESSRAFFVGATGDGTIYRGTLDQSTVTEFIPGGSDKQAAGMTVWRGKLYVAGGFLGTVLVYDIETRQVVASFESFGAGMLNDLVVTRAGDVFVTDSFVATLWHITAAQVASGGGTPEAIPVDPEIEYDFTPFSFNLNGIVALDGGRSFIVGQSNTGKLFRIDLDPHAPYGREIHQIAVEPLFSDGLLLDKGQLVVVTFAPAGLNFVKLDRRASSGTVIDRWTVATLWDPSTVARARNCYLVVNADFLTSTTPFTVTALTRNRDEDDE